MQDNIIIGKNAVMEQISRDPSRIEKIYLIKGFHNIREISAICRQKKIPFKIMDRNNIGSKLKIYCQKGVFAVITDTAIMTANDILEGYKIRKSGIMLLFDRITNVGNAGSIIRSSIAFGIRDFIFELNQSVSISAVLSKSSAGYSSHANIYRINSPSDLINKLKNNGISIISLDMCGEDIRKAEIMLPMLLILGSEEKGIRRTIISSSDKIIGIKTEKAVESLNVSNAASIALYEIYNRLNTNV